MKELKELALVVNMVVMVSESLDESLQQGDDEAFKFLENGLRMGIVHLKYLRIEDAGPHNAVFERKER